MPGRCCIVNCTTGKPSLVILTKKESISPHFIGIVGRAVSKGINGVRLFTSPRNEWERAVMDTADTNIRCM